MTRRMKMLWAREVTRRFFDVRYRSVVRTPDGRSLPVSMGRGPWNANYCADPFLFRKDGADYLFYETLDRTDKGILGCFKNVDGHWIQRGIVLQGPVHFSYPQVFEDGGAVWMMPESGDMRGKFRRGEVALYAAVDFPTRWEKRAVLIPQGFADATLCRRDGHYYLACFRGYGGEGAELWHAPALTGPWTRHPESANMGQHPRVYRCGGAFQEWNGTLYRVVQDCHADYGKRLFRIPVLELSPTSYREGTPELLMPALDWSVTCKHHTYNRLSDGQGRVSLEVIDVQDYVRKPWYRLVPAALKLAWHTCFRFKSGKGGTLVQFFGIQFVKGTPRIRPALAQVRLGGTRG